MSKCLKHLFIVLSPPYTPNFFTITLLTPEKISRNKITQKNKSSIIAEEYSKRYDQNA
jgi:hypothetical protein